MDHFFYDTLRIVNSLGCAIVLWRMYKDSRVLKSAWTPKLRNYYYGLAGAIFVIGARGIESMLQGNDGGILTFGATLVVAWCLTAQWGGQPYELFKRSRDLDPDMDAGLQLHYAEDNLGPVARWFENKSEIFKMNAILLCPIIILSTAMWVHYLIRGN